MTYTDPAAEFYAQADGHEFIGEFCTDCRAAHYGPLFAESADHPQGWDADEYARTAATYDVEIYEGSEDNDAPQSFRYSGNCAGCGTYQGGDYWPVILTPKLMDNQDEVDARQAEHEQWLGDHYEEVTGRSF